MCVHDNVDGSGLTLTLAKWGLMDLSMFTSTLEVIRLQLDASSKGNTYTHKQLALLWWGMKGDISITEHDCGLYPLHICFTLVLGKRLQSYIKS